MICKKMNTGRMNEFLAQVRAAHPRTLIIMILDGASLHRSKDLAVHQLENGLPRLAVDTKRLQSIAGWPLINSLNLKANWN